MRTRRSWIIAGVAAVCFVTGVALSHLIEPGVRVEKVTLAEDTPALKFIPTGAGPHPVALLAHGFASSKETLFRYAEALAAAGCGPAPVGMNLSAGVSSASVTFWTWTPGSIRCESATPVLKQTAA